MLIRTSQDIPYSEVTPKSLLLNRRSLLLGLPAAFLAARAQAGTGLGNLVKSPLSTSEKVNSFKDVTTYNNFYEFGTSKDQPAQLAKNFKTSPWMVSVEGEVANPRKFSMDEILKLAPLEERIYRHRCVEGWSIVVPWVGYSSERASQAGGAHLQGEVRCLRDLLRPQADAGGQARWHPAAIRGRTSPG